MACDAEGGWHSVCLVAFKPESGQRTSEETQEKHFAVLSYRCLRRFAPAQCASHQVHTFSRKHDLERLHQTQEVLTEEAGCGLCVWQNRRARRRQAWVGQPEEHSRIATSHESDLRNEQRKQISDSQ